MTEFFGMLLVSLENRFHSEQPIDYSDRPTILRFANDTIDEPVRISSLSLSLLHVSFSSATIGS
jgi:hypothetical protein